MDAYTKNLRVKFVTYSRFVSAVLGAPWIAPGTRPQVRSTKGPWNAKQQNSANAPNTTNCAMTASGAPFSSRLSTSFTVWLRRAPARVGTARSQTARHGMVIFSLSNLIEVNSRRVLLALL
ncbi:hypothetical protein N7510_010478 [Penicillium lagena]|uniref:uncharacterized protein n=1 Tax=Penicillium lagena TaxID=94218 RepID=UPI0025414D1F|nr:uncharacterized protein N7510_010478 [Penicillium lagena]KAJ5605324.1 hypothetical protein N7510_010478 [Penicillium lagena]